MRPAICPGFASDPAVTVIDLAHKMPRDPGLLYDDIRCNERGAIAVADIVAGALCPVLQKRWPDHVAADCAQKSSRL